MWRTLVPRLTPLRHKSTVSFRSAVAKRSSRGPSRRADEASFDKVKWRQNLVSPAVKLAVPGGCLLREREAGKGNGICASSRSTLCRLGTEQAKLGCAERSPCLRSRRLSPVRSGKPGELVAPPAFFFPAGQPGCVLSGTENIPLRFYAGLRPLV